MNYLEEADTSVAINVPHDIQTENKKEVIQIVDNDVFVVLVYYFKNSLMLTENVRTFSAFGCSPLMLCWKVLD